MIVLRGKRPDGSGWDVAFFEYWSEAEAVGAAWLSSGASTENEIEPLAGLALRAIEKGGGLAIGARVSSAEPCAVLSNEPRRVRVRTERGRERGEVYLRWTSAGDLELDIVTSLAMDARRARKGRR